MLILSTGGKGTGVEAEGSNFPFVQPGPDIQGLLADLWLAHEYHDVVLPLRVSRMAGFQQAFDGQASSAAITIIDANDAVVFESPTNTPDTYHWKDWGARLRIHEWLLGTSAVCRVIQHRAVPEPRSPWPAVINPVNGVLDERTSELLAWRLLQLSEPGGVVATGQITFVNGWNVDITNAPYREPLRNTTALTFAAAPGGGQGRHPGCQDSETLLRSVNGTGPDGQGNFTIAAASCYYARQPLTIGPDELARPTWQVDASKPVQLELGNDCGPCCECDDFVNVQLAILSVEAQLRSAAALAENTRDAFAVAKERWNAQKECRESQAVSVTAATTGMLYADLNIVVCNASSRCLIDTQINIKVETQPPGIWSVAPGTTYISHAGQTAMVPYQLSGPFGGVMNGWISAINPQSSGRIRTRVIWSDRLPAGTMLTVTVTAYASDRKNPSFPQTTTVTALMT